MSKPKAEYVKLKMNIFYFDTCAHRDLLNLKTKLDIDLFPMINQFHIGITKELEREYKNYHLIDSKLASDFIAVIAPEERRKFIEKYELDLLDEADIDLFIVGKRDRSVIISNDRALYYQCLAGHVQIYFLYSFLLTLVKQGHMKKNDFYKCYKYWEDTQRYPKGILNKIKTTIHKIS